MNSVHTILDGDVHKCEMSVCSGCSGVGDHVVQDVQVLVIMLFRKFRSLVIMLFRKFRVLVIMLFRMFSLPSTARRRKLLANDGTHGQVVGVDAV